MKQHSSILFLATCIGLAAATGCASSPSKQNTGGGGSSSTGTGGSSSTGTGGSSGNLTGVTLVPSATGWIDKTDVGNTIMVQGAWYPYGDSYGEAKCTSATFGKHAAGDCSVITMPDPVGTGFPNTAGSMCTTGTAAKVLDIVGMTGMPDYSNMWGAGIGLDLNASGGDLSTKSPYNATMAGVTGISFKIDTVPLSGLRVEFPMPLTNGNPAGSDYWGASSSYPASPAQPGLNVIRWADVKSPAAATASPVAFDPTQIESIQFHVPSSTSAASPYSFCISELTFLK